MTDNQNPEENNQDGEADLPWTQSDDEFDFASNIDPVPPSQWSCVNAYTTQVGLSFQLYTVLRGSYPALVSSPNQAHLYGRIQQLIKHYMSVHWDVMFEGGTPGYLHLNRVALGTTLGLGKVPTGGAGALITERVTSHLRIIKKGHLSNLVA